jgi:hypothetical protein
MDGVVFIFLHQALFFIFLSCFTPKAALGISREEVKLASRSRKGYWRMSGNSIVQRALTKDWLWLQGVPNMRQQWIDLHYGDANKSVSL